MLINVHIMLEEDEEFPLLPDKAVVAILKALKGKPDRDRASISISMLPRTAYVGEQRLPVLPEQNGEPAK